MPPPLPSRPMAGRGAVLDVAVRGFAIAPRAKRPRAGARDTADPRGIMLIPHPPVKAALRCTPGAAAIEDVGWGSGGAAGGDEGSRHADGYRHPAERAAALHRRDLSAGVLPRIIRVGRDPTRRRVAASPAGPPAQPGGSARADHPRARASRAHRCRTPHGPRADAAARRVAPAARGARGARRGLLAHSRPRRLRHRRARRRRRRPHGRDALRAGGGDGLPHRLAVQAAGDGGGVRAGGRRHVRLRRADRAAATPLHRRPRGHGAGRAGDAHGAARDAADDPAVQQRDGPCPARAAHARRGGGAGDPARDGADRARRGLRQERRGHRALLPAALRR